MNEGIAIAMYSMMITVVTFLGGFIVVVGVRMLTELSEQIGHQEGFLDYFERKLGDVDGKGRELMESSKGRWRNMRKYVMLDLMGVVLTVVVLLLFLSLLDGNDIMTDVLFGWMIFLPGITLTGYDLHKLIEIAGEAIRENRHFEVYRELALGLKIGDEKDIGALVVGDD